MIKAEVCPDHIKKMISIPPKYSVSQLVGYWKGKSGLTIFDRYARQRRRWNSGGVVCLMIHNCIQNDQGLDQVSGLVLHQGQVGAVLPGTHGVDLGRSPDGGSCHPHQSHRADADDRHVVAELDVCQLRPVETGGYHVADHTGGP